MVIWSSSGCPLLTSSDGDAYVGLNSGNYETGLAPAVLSSAMCAPLAAVIYFLLVPEANNYLYEKGFDEA